jgi:hypothetical protein
MPIQLQDTCCYLDGAATKEVLLDLAPQEMGMLPSPPRRKELYALIAEVGF